MGSVLITGIAGMVGSHLADFLLENTDWKIYGFCRWNDNLENIEHLSDRINKKEIALIAAESKSGPLSDIDASGTPDVLEISKLALEQTRAQRDYQTKLSDIQNKHSLAMEKLNVEKEKIKVSRENQANDLAVAKENAKGRAKKKLNNYV
jgi:hypothetical protein